VPSYAREVIRSTAGPRHLEQGELEKRVAERMRRAEACAARVQSSTPPELSLMIDESAFYRVRDPQAAREQLTHLIVMAKFKTVHLSIMPLSRGPHLGLCGPFELHKSADGTTTAFFERLLEDVVSNDPAVFDQLRGTFMTVTATAVHDEDAVGMLEAISAKL